MSATDTESLAATLADEGREELLIRCRDAYSQALDVHSDLVSIDAERIETMVQRAAADTDGLQWRRALADVAARRLDIDLDTALAHPAVVRAHQLVGAPSYEDGRASLAPPAPALEAPSAPELPAAEIPDELEELEATAAAELAAVMPSASRESEPEPAPDPAPVAHADEEPGDEALTDRAADFAREFMATATPARDDLTFEHEVVEPANAAGEADAGEVDRIVEFTAVHLGGVATLASGGETTVRLSEAGLDLLQADETIVGRLSWSEIAALEVSLPHGRRRRRDAPRLVVHTAGGSARFEVPGSSGPELQERIQPLVDRFGQ